MAEAYLKQGSSSLAAGKTYESLNFYTKAIQTSNNSTLKEALKLINKLAAQKQPEEKKWLLRLLLVGIAARFPAHEIGKAALDKIRNLAAQKNFTKPVIIIAGGCSSEAEPQIHTYENLILETFNYFKGTIISGGTTSGVSGLVGQIQQAYPNAVSSIGYVPKTKINLVDSRYSKIQYTEGDTFSPLEPLQYWIDLLASGVQPAEVKMLGLNGGQISAFEYHLALALGAQVAIIKGSGGEADKLQTDDKWNNLPNLHILPNSPSSVQVFVKA
jgi:hypothetical protein